MFAIRLARRAQRYYERLDADTAARIDHALDRLRENLLNLADPLLLEQIRQGD